MIVGDPVRVGDGITVGAPVLLRSVIIGDPVFLPAPTPGGEPVITWYRHVQTVPATIWHVVHNLGYDPAGLYTVDASGQQAWPNRIPIDSNRFDLDWGTIAMTGSTEVS